MQIKLVQRSLKVIAPKSAESWQLQPLQQKMHHRICCDQLVRYRPPVYVLNIREQYAFLSMSKKRLTIVQRQNTCTFQLSIAVQCGSQFTRMHPFYVAIPKNQLKHSENFSQPVQNANDIRLTRRCTQNCTRSIVNDQYQVNTHWRELGLFERSNLRSNSMR